MSKSMDKGKKDAKKKPVKSAKEKKKPRNEESGQSRNVKIR